MDPKTLLIIISGLFLIITLLIIIRVYLSSARYNMQHKIMDQKIERLSYRINDIRSDMSGISISYNILKEKIMYLEDNAKDNDNSEALKEVLKKLEDHKNKLHLIMGL